MDLFNRRSDQRKDAVITEVQVLLSIYNLIISHNADGWEITQTDLADQLQLGERTIQRITKRLEKLGYLKRSAGTGHASYIYSVPRAAIMSMLLDLQAKTNLFIIEYPNGGISIVEDFEEYWQIVTSIGQNQT